MTKADDDPVSEVTWEDPLPKTRGRYDWERIATKLRARPEEWALVFERDRTSVANALRQGIRGIGPESGFEIRTTNNVRLPVRTCSLYMRYVPSKDRSK